ncbi:MAG TPA: L-threonylcarbamoyladenylate synthase [Actinomadura sp.]|nr:L-threonylcarbamoyladenylate synthase [Actinomadura sp.]
MSRRYDCSEPLERNRGIAEAAAAVRRGDLVVLPTDTVYGVGCDAFTPTAVTALLAAKGRGRDMPPPVLVGSVRAGAALVEDLGTYGQDLIDEFWPGALTIVCRANPNLSWDLGDAKGTVAVRMPLDQIALELLRETGPMAVSSANLSGGEAARSAGDAEKQLGEAVSVYLDAGPSGKGEASSIIDLTGPVPRLLRAGAISEDRLRAVCGVLLVEEDEQDEEDAGETPEQAEEAGEHAGQGGDGEAGAPVAADGGRAGSSSSPPSLRKDGVDAVSSRKDGAEAVSSREDAGPADRSGNGPSLRKGAVDVPSPGDTEGAEREL